MKKTKLFEETELNLLDIISEFYEISYDKGLIQDKSRNSLIFLEFQEKS
ncbi:MAG TPA: hypothetical protein VF248_05755 [Nitrososphaeraceae archaeon]